MKRKNVFLLAAIVIVLLAVYGVWHYSPLRHLTRSKSQPDQAYSSTIKSRNKPIIVTKKILPETRDTQQTGDLPRPLVVLKKLSPQEKSRLVEPREKSTDPAAAGEKTLQAAPQDSPAAKVNESQAVQPAKPLKPQPVQKTAAPVKRESYHPYSIMLSSCRLPQSARKVVSNYKKVGLAPYVVKVKFDEGDEWLRVLAGHYKTRQEALKAKQEQRLSGAIVKRTPYTNLIGTYASMDEMQAELSRIKALGYSPYFLKTQTGQFKLVVGAFITKEGAENQRTELQSKGIQNTVIIR
jgi:septal ring-binding cell division protein DamX